MENLLNTLNLCFPALHSLLFVVGLSSNVTLLRATFLRTPKTLLSYSVIIKLGTLNDIVSVCCDFCTMQRMVVIPGNVVYLSDGPCGLVSARSCYLAYCMQMCSQTYSIHVLTWSFAFRLYILHHSIKRYGVQFFL